MTYTIEAITKEKLQKQIETLQQQQIIEADIRKVVEEFKHYKQVNKRFTDRLKELGYHAWMIKDYSHKIGVSMQVKSYEIDLRVYGDEFTWDKILHELDRERFKEREQEYKEKLASVESDVEQLRKLHAIVLEMKSTLKNFDIWKIESDLSYAIRNSK
jgi:hypothetical protein